MLRRVSAALCPHLLTEGRKGDSGLVCLVCLLDLSCTGNKQIRKVFSSSQERLSAAKTNNIQVMMNVGKTGHSDDTWNKDLKTLLYSALMKKKH